MTRPGPTAWVVMGVSGSGKSTLARALARRIDARFLDADDFHPPANVAKMRSGQPLTDADREGWLVLLRERLATFRTRPGGVVLACSALRERYRALLGVDGQHTRLVYLNIQPASARARVANRPGHFMPPSLIDSQFETLEVPQQALVLDAEAPLDALIEACLAARTGAP